MISTQGLAALRIAATLAHGVPKLRLRIRGGAALVDVGWSGGVSADPVREVSSSDGGAITLTPCGFRKAVAQAHQLHEQGRRMAFLDLAPGIDPSIDVDVPTGGVAFGGGIYRVPLDGRWLFAFGTTLDAETCRSIGAGVVDEHLPMEMLVALGVRGDDDTDVTIVYAESPAGVDELAHARIIDLLQSMLARFTAHELISDLAGSGVHQS